MTTSFAQVSQRAQYARLRPLALQFVSEFGLDIKSLKLINYGYNATYKLTTQSKEIYALKLILDSPRRLPHLQAEVTWCNQLAQKGIPLAKPHSATIPQLHLQGFHKPVFAQCFHWLPGRSFPKLPNQVQLRKVANIYQILHNNPPILAPGEFFPECRDVLIGTECRITDPLLLDALEECNATFKKVWQKQPPTAIHFDLHAQNIIYLKGIVHPFDFEFTHVGPPLIDIADLFFSFTYSATKIDLGTAIWPAFDYQPSDFALTNREFQSLILARKLLLVNDLYHSTNPSLQAKLPRALQTTTQVVNQFKKSGRYEVSALS
jgi:Ser/Thr protein kinase RdoA (MazF antagonist)